MKFLISYQFISLKLVTLVGMVTCCPSLSSSLPYKSVCDKINFDECQSKLDFLAELPESLNDLNVKCGHAEASVQCFVDRAQSCPDNQFVKSIVNAKLQADTFLDILCRNESTKLEYMKSVPCLLSLRPHLDKCELRVYQTMLDVKANQRLSSIQKDLIHQCCVFQEYLTCRRQHIVRHCGPDTRRLTNLLVLSVRNRHTEICESFYELESCKELDLDSNFDNFVDQSDSRYEYTENVKTLNNFDQLNPLKVQRLSSPIPPIISGQSYSSSFSSLSPSHFIQLLSLSPFILLFQ